MSGIELEPLTAHTGSIVHGVDLREPLDDDVFAAIHEALVERCVLFFRDQDLSDEEHLSFAGRFGAVNWSPWQEGPLEHLEDSPEHPPSADLWHTDMTFLAEPPEVAVLSMRHAAPAGGDTLWANLYEAHDHLSPPMRAFVASLAQEVRRTVAISEEHRPVRYEPSPAADMQLHPLVRVHPVTGRPALFLCGQSISGIAGLNPDESETLLAFLRSRVGDPNVQCRWRWRDNDLAVWDERSTNHRALSDHWPRHHRHVRRCTVGASAPLALSPHG